MKCGINFYAKNLKQRLLGRPKVKRWRYQNGSSRNSMEGYGQDTSDSRQNYRQVSTNMIINLYVPHIAGNPVTIQKASITYCVSYNNKQTVLNTINTTLLLIKQHVSHSSNMFPCWFVNISLIWGYKNVKIWNFINTDVMRLFEGTVSHSLPSNITDCLNLISHLLCKDLPLYFNIYCTFI